jgi:hypothetical protein
MPMVRMRLRETGRIVVCDDEQARLWIAQGYAEPAPEAETTARTTVPVPARVPDVETR